MDERLSQTGLRKLPNIMMRGALVALLGTAGCVAATPEDGSALGPVAQRSDNWASTTMGMDSSSAGMGSTSYSSSYGASTTGNGSTSYGMSTAGNGSTSYSSSYGMSTTGNDPTSYGMGSTGNGSTSDGISTTGMGSASYGMSTTDVSSATTTDATTSASPSSSSSTSTSDGLWYAVPSGDLDAGFDAYVADNSACSGKVDEILSVCLDAHTLKYPDYDECTEEPNYSQENCQTWCQDSGHTDGDCITEAEGPDHCECTAVRQEFGIEADEPGCVATYTVGDTQCADTPRDYTVATCQYADPDGGEMNLLVNKRTSVTGCAESDIEDEELNCKSWCRQNHDKGGYCTTTASNECGGNEAAHCICADRKWANKGGGANLASCREEFENPDACPDDGPTTTWGSSCVVGAPKTINYHQTAGCTDWDDYMNNTGVDGDFDFTQQLDCNEWCKDEGHSSGECEADAVQAECPSGATVDSARCTCT